MRGSWTGPLAGAGLAVLTLVAPAAAQEDPILDYLRIAGSILGVYVSQGQMSRSEADQRLEAGARDFSARGAPSAELVAMRSQLQVASGQFFGELERGIANAQSFPGPLPTVVSRALANRLLRTARGKFDQALARGSDPLPALAQIAKVLAAVRGVTDLPQELDYFADAADRAKAMASRMPAAPGPLAQGGMGQPGGVPGPVGGPGSPMPGQPGAMPGQPGAMPGQPGAMPGPGQPGSRPGSAPMPGQPAAIPGPVGGPGSPMPGQPGAMPGPGSMPGPGAPGSMPGPVATGGPGTMPGPGPMPGPGAMPGPGGAPPPTSSIPRAGSPGVSAGGMTPGPAGPPRPMPGPAAPPPPPVRASDPTLAVLGIGTMEAEAQLEGFGWIDVVGRSFPPVSDGEPDTEIVLKLAAPGMILDWIEVRSAPDPTQAIWNTRGTDGALPLGLAQRGRLLSDAKGSVSGLQIEDFVVLSLYVQDDGLLERLEQPGTITITYRGGDVATIPIEPLW